jgi:hypothetical protein
MPNPKCPVPTCYATKFKSATIENEGGAEGNKALFVIMCDQGHVIGPDMNVVVSQLQSSISHQISRLAAILGKEEV